VRAIKRLLSGLVFFAMAGVVGQAQMAASAAQPTAVPVSTAAPASQTEVDELRQMVRELAMRVNVLEAEQRQRRTVAVAYTASATPANFAAHAAPTAPAGYATPVAYTAPVAPAGYATPAGYAAPVAPAAEDSSVSAGRLSEEVAAIPVAAAPVASAQAVAPAPAAKSERSLLPGELGGGVSLNYTLDAYYGYDFDHPIGRVEYLRAYDVLSNAFSINQAGIVLDMLPDVAGGRRYGFRLDLQYGQATETLQGNPANEPRPEIYRNIFQAFGTYVVPLGSGLTVDFGKWASSLGIEGNYTKDQMNYSRSYWFTYLPFYHAGVRTNYKINDKVAVNYWIVNGTDQSEPTNSFKDELFGLALQPTKDISWTVNYYLGQDHPDTTPATNCGPTPVQPGLCLAPITPAPNGKQHIIDSYATWNASPKLTFALEGDYVISREWANAAPGESSAPSHVDGGAGYAHYQWTPHVALATRGEYMSDRGGLFSGSTQALKEVTGTYEYKFGEGFISRIEYRRDWSNLPLFLTNQPGVLAKNQDTLTLGLIWWYGGLKGAW
jgi:hypothetical protein